MNEVYRGVVVVSVMLNDEYGNKVPGRRLHYTKTYNRPGTAAGQATRLANMWGASKVVDKYVEKAVAWEKC